MGNLKHLNYKSKNIETNYLNNMRNYRFLQVKNSLFELENDQ